MTDKSYDRVKQKSAQGLTPELTIDLEDDVLVEPKNNEDRTFDIRLSQMSQSKQKKFNKEFPKKG